MSDATPAGRTQFADMLSEQWLIRRISQHTHSPAITIETEIFAGVTARPERADRFRKLIGRHHLGTVICGRRADGKTMTYAEAFEKLFGQKYSLPTSNVETDRAETE